MWVLAWAIQLSVATAHGLPAPGSPTTPATALEPPAANPLAWEWFPSQPPTLAPYLSQLNLYGANCLVPGALIASDPMSDAAQWVKTQLAAAGITYRLNQAFALDAMSDVTTGNSTLGSYNMQLLANWMVFQSADLGGTSGWLTLQANAGAGFGFNVEEQSPQGNIGSVTWPLYGWSNQPAYISQLSWSQSFLNGTLIVDVGFIDPTLYLDANTYANNQYSQLLNWAFVNSQVIPYAYGALGAVVQWQPCEWFYAMFSTGANNTLSGRAPWHDVSGRDWTCAWELGLISKDTLGLGPGVYRLQPFWATFRGESGGGLCLNIEQQLGKDSKLGFFGRFGVGSQSVTLVNGASAQIAAGLAVLGPNITGKERNSMDYLACGFVWTQAAQRSAIHPNEFGVEVTYSLPVTPTISLQPDVQVLWDPAFGRSDASVVFQLQLVLTW